MSIVSFIEKSWYESSLWLILLRPLSVLAGLVSQRKRRKYLEALENKYSGEDCYRPKLPVLVVGNITAGGTGKTPIVRALVKKLVEDGYRPAVLTRGFKSQIKNFPYMVDPNDQAVLVGDEPYLLATTQFENGYVLPVIVDPKRAQSAKWVESNLTQVNCLVLDDGMQHYGIQRDIEISVIDGNRWFGNKKMLPEGPLRESLSRLETVDFNLMNVGVSGKSTSKTDKRGQASRAPELLEGGGVVSSVNSTSGSIVESSNATFRKMFKENVGEWVDMRLVESNLYSVVLDYNCLVNAKTGERVSCSTVLGMSVDAIAGIGNPNKFFSTLKNIGFSLERKTVFPDHHGFVEKDLEQFIERPLIFTEKDWVKIKPFAKDNWWYLPVEARIVGDFYEKLDSKILALSK